MYSEVFGVEINPLVAFLWSVFVGLVFSTVGAAGGILAGVGHISVFGIPQANNIKLMNQILIFTSTLISVPSYWRQRRVIVILGVLLGVGSIAGALIGSTLSYKFLPDLKSYKPLFGIFTLIVALKIFYDTFHKKKKEQIKDIEESIKERGASDLTTKKVSLTSIELEFLGKTYSFNPLVPVLAGFVVAIVSSALGVGGGFLLVPFMVSVMGLPMFLVPGTSALSILITMLVSAGNYLKLGAQIDIQLLGIEIVGIVIGSFVGPHLSKVLKEKKLRLILGFLLLYIGIGYTVGGWVKKVFGIRIV
ncbi:sulfite exporter TauE/SafE family protein [Hydrogenivirga sp. 128-5-R1-1]|uniref:sulfite exporter TauE/SafE family protein n=1 Tax=Hydrogenivirga sp. 128-5-R1-1 TaxID=392423 RepID=UPI00015F3763|nr:sulfite exporter TauE/SafE family protein [Hydrogenivirga sp. 128-5-R1-1]EDP76346.1 hypothetical protein HG1285_02028 [Hydrogenivirga sp. 128-5-R1-1]